MNELPVVTTKRKVWYILYFEESAAEFASFDAPPPSSILIDPSIDWDDFRGILLVTLNQLRGFDKHQIRLYEDESSFKERKEWKRTDAMVGHALGSGGSPPMVILATGFRPQRVTASIQFRPCRIPFFCESFKGVVIKSAKNSMICSSYRKSSKTTLCSIIKNPVCRLSQARRKIILKKIISDKKSQHMPPRRFTRL
jgi:hypothetical protein